jgi:hypothetical protein
MGEYSFDEMSSERRKEEWRDDDLKRRSSERQRARH